MCTLHFHEFQQRILHDSQITFGSSIHSSKDLIPFLQQINHDSKF